MTTSPRDPSAPALRASYDPLAQPVLRSSDRFPWIHLLIFVLGAALVAIAVSDYIERQRVKMLTHWETELSEVVSDRARLIGNWLDARRADAEVLAASPSVRALLSSRPRTDEALIRHLGRVVAAYGYASAAIFDTHGRIVAQSRGGLDPNTGRDDVARAVARTGRVRIEVSEDIAERQWLTIAVPALPDDELGAPSSRGSVALRMRADSSLFPLLTDETLTRKGESLLFRLDAADGGYLSPLRRRPGRPIEVEHSLGALRSLARAAGDTRAAFGEVTDYREIAAFVAVRAIPNTGWGLAVKVDRDEATAQYRRAARLGLAASAFLVLALAGFLISMWRHQQRASLVRAQEEHERAIFNLKGYAEKIVAGVPSGLLLLSADLRIVSANPSFLESFELREEDIEGRPLSDVIRAEGLVRRAREVLQSGVALRDVLFDLHLSDRQETRPVLIALTPVRMAGEESARLLLIVKDLTEEERLQAARRTSEERFRDLVQGLDAIVWEADAATLRFSFVSQRAEAILGYPIEQWIEADEFFATRIHPDDRARTVAACRDAVARRQDHQLEYRALAADGREVWLRDIIHVVRDAGAGSPQLRGLAVDVTERKRSEEALRQTEEQLRQAQKMDAVGKLAGGIAHDFNNLLMVIRSDADLILRRLGSPHALRANAEGIREAADQAATLTRQLLAFSRKQVLAPAELDLNAVVASIQKMLQRLIGETINLVTVTDPGLWRVRADPGQLEQMIVNLAVNARDAMPDGGRLTIRTANAELDAATAGQSGVKPGSYALLEVSDTGVGMDAETRAHLFEPFYTTKGQGTGLGLSTVYGIVNQSGGHIRVESEKGRGATLRVYLPRVEPAPAAESATAGDAGEQPRLLPAPTASAPARPAAGVSRQETILLVEDARRVREVVREILSMHGYDVLEARDGAEALELSERHRGPIHLMLTDVVMPKVSGHELARRLEPLRPEMRVLYMSGYTDDDIVRHGVLGAGMAFIAKPFTPDALATKVRAVLASNDASARSDGGVRPLAAASPREESERASFA